MANATPSPSPNPNALRFALDTTISGSLSCNSEEEAASNSFCAAVFSAPGVASIFGVNDFVTVTRQPGADWDPIVDAVVTAARDHL